VRALAIALLAALALPSAALAAGGTNAPPGNSGVDEYLEAIPDATGNRPAQHITRSGSTTHALPQAVAQKLDALGADGRAVAGFVAATAPKRVSSSAPSEPSATSGGTQDALPSGGAPAIGRAAADTVDGGGGLGLLLPIALGGILVAAVAARLVRRGRA
jgi:hypothetical protein